MKHSNRTVTTPQLRTMLNVTSTPGVIRIVVRWTESVKGVELIRGRQERAFVWNGMRRVVKMLPSTAREIVKWYFRRRK